MWLLTHGVKLLVMVKVHSTALEKKGKNLDIFGDYASIVHACTLEGSATHDMHT